MSRLTDVPDDKLGQIFRKCQVSLVAQLEHATYANLAQKIGISESALKQFLRRGRLDGEETRRRGAAFERIYQFLENPSRNADDSFSLELSELNYDSEEYRQARKQGYELILHMLDVDAMVVEKYGKKLGGHYLCFRYSAIKDHIMISRLEIRKNDEGNWDFQQINYDKFGELKESDGLFIPKNNSFYLLGDLEKGAALDILLFKEPISYSFKYIAGIQMSVDNDFRPFSARVLAFKCDSLNSELDFTSNEFLVKYCRATNIDDFKNTGFFSGDGAYDAILRRLMVDNDDRIMRIEPR